MGDFEYGANTWEQSGEHHPRNGNAHLIATQDWDCWTDHDAILKLDLQGVGQDDYLELEFWMQFATRGNPDIEDRRTARVMVRGEDSEDAENWIDISGTLVPPEGEYTQYIFDLGAALAANRIVRDDDVYIKLNRRGFHKRAPVTFDNVAVRTWIAGSPAAAPEPATAWVTFTPLASDSDTRLAPEAPRLTALPQRKPSPTVIGRTPDVRRPAQSSPEIRAQRSRGTSSWHALAAAHDLAILSLSDQSSSVPDSDRLVR
jgi:hypothetical protein